VTDDYKLYDGSPPHVVGSDTSRAARDAIVEGVNALQSRVLALLSIPLTDEEMQLAGMMPANTQRPRRIELVQLGRVCDSGIRRKTSRGKAAVVWQLHREDGCTCSYREPRQAARPVARSIGPAPVVAVPSDETLRAALVDLGMLWKAQPKLFGPALVEVAKWLRAMTGGTP
jgi:hypothetical protein